MTAPEVTTPKTLSVPIVYCDGDAGLSLALLTMSPLSSTLFAFVSVTRFQLSFTCSVVSSVRFSSDSEAVSVRRPRR